MSREEAERKKAKAQDDILNVVGDSEMGIKDLMTKFFPEPEYSKDVFAWALTELITTGDVKFDGRTLHLG